METPLNTKKGWQSFGKLTGGQANPTVQCQAEFKETGTYTVQFSIEPAANAPVQAIATITWFTEGNNIVRQMSVYNGASISGVGQGVKVKIEDITTAAAGLGVVYPVSCSVAKGLRANIQQPPILQGPSFVVTPGTSGLAIAVPQGVGVVSAYVSVISADAPPVPITDQDFWVSMFNGVTRLRTYNPRDFQWVPLVPGTVVLEMIDNDTGAKTFAGTVTFGIDG